MIMISFASLRFLEARQAGMACRSRLFEDKFVMTALAEFRTHALKPGYLYVQCGEFLTR